MRLTSVLLFCAELGCGLPAHASKCSSGASVVFKSGDVDIQGQFFFPQEEAPSRLAVVLAGFPPAERGETALLVKPICEAGWGVLYFYYRGTRSTAGRFSIVHAIEDVIAAVTFLKTAYTPNTIALVGHSFGGLLALQAGLQVDSAACVVAASAPNPAIMGETFASNAEAREQWAEVFNSFVGPDKPVTSGDGYAEAAYFAEQGASLDVVGQADRLAGRHLLLVGASEDGLVPVPLHHTPLVTALRELDMVALTDMVIDTDHDYTTRRGLLAATVTAWLDEGCNR